MSIPKEPRQLMINLMYLVLTALLALNVSAEVMNAFFSLDKSIGVSNGLMNDSNKKVIEGMKAATEKREAYKPLVPAAQEISSIIADFNSYIDGVRTQLTDAAGGLYTAEETNDQSQIGRPKRYRDKEIPTRLFIDGTDGNPANALGPQIRAKIDEVQQKIFAKVAEVGKINVEGAPIMTPEEIKAMQDKVTLEIDDEAWKAADKPSWEHFTFDHMPVAAVYPVLSKFQNDARSTEATLLNALAKEIGAVTIEFDKFEPVASAEKGYILKGDKYSAEIFLSASSSQAAQGISYRVNGTALPIKDGKGIYTTTGSRLGENSYKVDISLKNPFTGKVDNFSKTFKYEVGEGSMSIELTKMNVFYVGLENPIAVSVAGAPSSSVRVTGSGCSVNNAAGSGNYTVTVNKPGTCSINISAQGLPSKSFEYRVLRVPSPTPLLGTIHNSKAMPNGTFKAQGGIAPVLEDFVYDIKCDMIGFDATYHKKRADPVTKPNRGARFSPDVQSLIQKAEPGDVYYFDNIKAKCPGDPAARDLGGLVFKIQ